MTTGTFAASEGNLMLCGGTDSEDQSVEATCRFINLETLNEDSVFDNAVNFQSTNASLIYLQDDAGVMVIGGKNDDGSYNDFYKIVSVDPIADGDQVTFSVKFEQDLPGSANGCAVKINDTKYFYTRFVL